nr:hypothetical protein [Desulfobulbaceae bacterium]
MHKPIIIVGLGEMAGVFAKGFLRSGYPVYPVTRNIRIEEAASNYPDPGLVLLAVAEKDFSSTLKTIPEAWQTKLTLLQNELLPEDWTSHGINNPTVISVWFEKKKGREVKILLPSPIFGPKADILSAALATEEIPTTILSSPTELTNALVMKNLFVFTINIAGLAVGGTTGQLLERHRDFAEEVFRDVVAIQESLTHCKLDGKQLFNSLTKALTADPDHKCRGRSAPDRLRRALETAHRFNIQTPALNKVLLTCSPDS